MRISGWGKNNFVDCKTVKPKTVFEIKKHIGYLAGDISLYDSMSGIQLIRYLTRLGRNTNWAYVETLAKNLQISLEAKIGTLSKGNKQVSTEAMGNAIIACLQK